MAEYTAEMASVAAAKGAAWMDEHCEGWTLLLDLDRLDLAEPDACILGQTAHCVTQGEAESNTRSSYFDALRHITGSSLEPSSELWAEQHGFMADTVTVNEYLEDEELEYDEADEMADAENHARWEMLTIAWKEEIRKRA